MDLGANLTYQNYTKLVNHSNRKLFQITHSKSNRMSSNKLLLIQRDFKKFCGSTMRQSETVKLRNTETEHKLK
jgi:hypothetical protein